MSENIRSLALESLLLIRKSGRKGNEITDAVLEKYSYLPKTERAFYLRLVRGTLENTIRSDLILDVYSKTPSAKMKPVIREILRMAVYQIGEMDSVPDRAAVNEAVKLTVKKGFGNLKGFVNGVLRSYIREPERFQIPSKDKPAEYLQAEYSMPLFLTRKWTERFGLSTAEKICAAFREEGRVTIRLRRSVPETAARMERAGVAFLEKEGVGCTEEAVISCVPAPYVMDAYRIASGAESLADIPPFKEGSIIVQDVSSMLAVYAAGIKTGMKILDVCAAPGGKSILAADLAGENGIVVARDISEARAFRMEENIRRCGLSNIEIEVRDACDFDKNLAGKMDVVLVDAPCSGYGVIGKKCDIIFSASEEKEDALAALQKDILYTAARYVRPGGVLIYSTCTINEKENEDNVRWFLDTHSNSGLSSDGQSEALPESPETFQTESLEPYLPEELRDESVRNGFLQLLPGVHDCDGFFIARFRRSQG